MDTEHPLNEKPKTPKNQWLGLAIVLFAAIAVGAIILLAARYTLQTYLSVQQDLQSSSVPSPSKSTETPTIKTEVIASGLSRTWDLVFLPDGELLFTQRAGTVSMLKDGAVQQLADIEDVYAQGEGGLLGLAVDPNFAENRHLYTCYNSTKNPDNAAAGPLEILVVRWRVNNEVTALESRQDIITGITAKQSGRHSGCRLAFGPDGYLWVGTGDAAMTGTPQDPHNLAGKILRVDREGKAAPGNLGGDFDPRIYSYGHRNTQGIAFLKQSLGDIIGYSVEHGSNIDDEVNPLAKGNFGWDPTLPNYNEAGISMTDKTKFPDAIEPIWKSGQPTQAPSGTETVEGRRWKAWDGALAIAMLKSQHLKILQLDDKGKVSKEEKVLTDRGRLRAVRQGPDGNLYITTDNGQNDLILRVSPQ